MSTTKKKKGSSKSISKKKVINQVFSVNDILLSEKETIKLTKGKKKFYFEYLSDENNCVQILDFLPHLSQDRDFMTKIIRKRFGSFKHAHNSLKRDFQFVLQAVSINGQNLKFIAEDYLYTIKLSNNTIIKDFDVHGYLDYEDHDTSYGHYTCPSRGNFYSRPYKKGSVCGYNQILDFTIIDSYWSETFDYCDNEEVVLASIYNNNDTEYDTPLLWASKRLQNDFKIVKESVSRNPYAIRYASKRLQKNTEIIIEAVKGDWSYFSQAPQKLQTKILQLRENNWGHDYETILSQVSKNGLRLENYSQKIKDNTKIVEAAVNNNGKAYLYCSPRLKQQKKFFKKYSPTNNNIHRGNVLSRISRFILEKDCQKVYYEVELSTGDIDYCCDIDDNLKKNPLQYRVLTGNITDNIFPEGTIFQSREGPDSSEWTFNCKVLGYYTFNIFKDDFELLVDFLMKLDFEEHVVSDVSSIFKTNIHKNSLLFMIANKMNDDYNFCIKTLSKNGHFIKLLTKKLQADFKVALTAVSSYYHQPVYSYPIQYVSNDLRDNKKIAVAAVSKGGGSLQYVSDRLKKDYNVVLAAVKEDGYSLKYAYKDLQKNKKISLEAIKKSPDIIIQLGDTIKLDYRYISGPFLLKLDGLMLYHMPETIKDNPKCVLIAIENNAASIKYASMRLQNDSEFMMTAFKKNPLLIEYLSKEFKYSNGTILYRLMEHFKCDTREQIIRKWNLKRFRKYQRTLKRQINQLTKNHIDLSSTYSELGRYASALGECDRAKKYILEYNRILTLNKKKDLIDVDRYFLNCQDRQ